MQRIKNNEFGYLGNPNVKRDGVETEFTKEEIKEYLKCMKDPVHFAKKYVKIISLDEGLVPFNLYPYQKKMFKHFNQNRFSIVLACRQSGKSISIKLSRYSRTRARSHVRCSRVSPSRSRTYLSFYSQELRH